VPFGRWRRTTRSGSDALDAGEPINGPINIWIAGRATDRLCLASSFFSNTAVPAGCSNSIHVKVKYTDIAVRSLTCHAATGTRMPYGITQCYLPPDRGDIPAFIP